VQIFVEQTRLRVVDGEVDSYSPSEHAARHAGHSPLLRYLLPVQATHFASPLFGHAVPVAAVPPEHVHVMLTQVLPLAKVLPEQLLHEVLQHAPTKLPMVKSAGLDGAFLQLMLSPYCPTSQNSNITEEQYAALALTSRTSRPLLQTATIISMMFPGMFAPALP
jgi:hypothetical protein